VSVTAAFERTRAEGRAALIGYLPVGYPSVDGSIAAIEAMVDAGVDIVEVGLPYSDPVMDGPTIQRATEHALAAGARTTDTFRVVAAAAATGVPVLVMTYWNPVERFGVDRFAAALAEAGGAGLITPDLVPDEAGEWLTASDTYGLDRVFLVAPSSTDARIASTVQSCRGFVYATSVMGVTGAREATSTAGPELVARTRVAAADAGVPIGVGLGVRDGKQAAEVASYADGVIVGSALVRCLLDGGDDTAAGLSALSTLTRDLADGLGRAAVPS
jgi:tryptophan synthase alpha chain